MGPGFNRMNPVTIQQTTQGLLRYLQQQAPQQLADNGVIIGERGREGIAQHSTACCLGTQKALLDVPHWWCQFGMRGTLMCPHVAS